MKKQLEELEARCKQLMTENIALLEVRSPFFMSFSPSALTDEGSSKAHRRFFSLAACLNNLHVTLHHPPAPPTRHDQDAV
jgi:hypothetical protein